MLHSEDSASPEPDEALATRLRDLALVELDALTSGISSDDAQALTAEFADDVADALRHARLRIAALRHELEGPDPLKVVDLPSRQRASETAQSGLERIRTQLIQQAEAGRALAKLAELASSLVGKLAEADRRK